MVGMAGPSPVDLIKLYKNLVYHLRNTCYACGYMVFAYHKRWRGRSKGDVRTAMTNLVAHKIANMTPEQLSEQGKRMAAKRGDAWRIVDGKRQYYFKDV